MTISKFAEQNKTITDVKDKKTNSDLPTRTKENSKLPNETKDQQFIYYTNSDVFLADSVDFADSSDFRADS